MGKTIDFKPFSLSEKGKKGRGKRGKLGTGQPHGTKKKARARETGAAPRPDLRKGRPLFSK